MIAYLILISIISIFEFRYMNKKKQRGEKVMFILLAILAITMAYFYSKNPYGINISKFTLRLFGYDK